MVFMASRDVDRARRFQNCSLWSVDQNREEREVLKLGEVGSGMYGGWHVWRMACMAGIEMREKTCAEDEHLGAKSERSFEASGAGARSGIPRWSGNILRLNPSTFSSK